MNGGAHFTTWVFANSSGVPYSNCKLYHYAAGGVVDKDIYSDEGKTTPLAQPFIGNACGRVSFYADGDYHFIVKDSSGNDLTPAFDMDNVRITKDSTGIWEGDWGDSYPSAVASSKGHLFSKIISNIMRGLAINANGSAYSELFNWDANGLMAFNDLLMKLPFADIRAFGAVIDGSTNDTAAVQATINSLINGGVVLIPTGTGLCIIKNVTCLDNILFLGLGLNAGFKLKSDATTSDWMIKSGTKRKLGFSNLQFDGNNIGSGTYMLKLEKTSGGAMDILIDKCKFYNHQGNAAVYVTGSGVSYFGQLIITNNFFEDLAGGIYAQYTKLLIEGNNFLSINKSVTSKPVFLEDCLHALVVNNSLNTWGADVAGIHLTDTTDSKVEGNIMPGTEAFSILEDGTSDYNMIVNNNVRGGHINDISSAGAATIVDLNQGSNLKKNGASGGTVSNTDYDYVLVTSITTSAGDDLVINDTAVSFGDAVISEDENRSVVILTEAIKKCDYVRFYGKSDGTENFLYPIKTITDDDTVVLSTTNPPLKVAAAAKLDNIGSGDAYKILPNITDDSPTGWEWEAEALGSVVLTLTDPSGDSGTIDIWGAESLIALVVTVSGSAGFNPKDLKVGYNGKDTYLYDYEDADPAISDGFLTMAFLWNHGGVNTATFTAQDNHAGTGTVTIEVFRLKRQVDL